MTDRSVTLTRRFAASPDTVWAAWTTEAALRTWYAPLEGWIVGDATVDARVGGGYRVTFGPEPDGDLYVEEGSRRSAAVRAAAGRHVRRRPHAGVLSDVRSGRFRASLARRR